MFPGSDNTERLLGIRFHVWLWTLGLPCTIHFMRSLWTLGIIMVYKRVYSLGSYGWFCIQADNAGSASSSVERQHGQHLNAVVRVDRITWRSDLPTPSMHVVCVFYLLIYYFIVTWDEKNFKKVKRYNYKLTYFSVARYCNYFLSCG